MKPSPKKPVRKSSSPRKPASSKKPVSGKKPRGWLGDDMSPAASKEADRIEKEQIKMRNQWLTDMANTPPSQRAPQPRTGPVAGARSSLYSRLTGGLTNRGK